MKREQRYGIKSLSKDFPNEKACLDFLFEAQHSRECSCEGRYSLKSGRRQFQCSKCRYQIAPTANTLFHKSDTPLTLWFKAILTFSNAKSGISAKEMERQLEVTYKTAWRMLHLIRKALEQEGKLSGDVEMDTAYFGGRKNAGKNNENLSEAVKAKSVVMGLVQRGGEVRASVVPDVKMRTLEAKIVEHVQMGTQLYTDELMSYSQIGKLYPHDMVKHSSGQYAKKGGINSNSMESFWAIFKRGYMGTYHNMSKKHLQRYVDEYVYRFNTRGESMQDIFTNIVLRVSAHGTLSYKALTQ